MELRVQRVSFPKGRRVIAVSDIHGWCDMLKGLLQKIDFSDGDILVLVGDVFEKGTQNLELLRYLIELSQTNTIYKVMGNCDIIYEDLFEEFTRENGETLLGYFERRERSEGLPHQMTRAVGMEPSENIDLEAWRKALKEQLPEEVEFLRNWVHILESEQLIFVHAGLTSPNLEEQKNWTCRKNDCFMSQGIRPEKMCVVGHWPVENYPSDGKLDMNPRMDREKNICSIDGGCIVKRSGQLNALILPDGDPNQASWTGFDLLPEVTALDPQNANEPRSLLWGNGYQWVEKLEEQGDFTLCRQIKTGETFLIHEKDLYIGSDGRFSAACATEYEPEVAAGEKLKLLRETSRGYLVKKDGVTGWYRGRIES